MVGTCTAEDPQWRSGNGITIERFYSVFVHCRLLVAVRGIVMRKTSKRIVEETKTREAGGMVDAGVSCVNKTCQMLKLTCIGNDLHPRINPLKQLLIP